MYRTFSQTLNPISKSANVSFYEERDDHYTPYFRNIDIQTNGKVKSSVKVTTDNYSLTTVNAIKITEDEIENINATNYILTGALGDVPADFADEFEVKVYTKNYEGIKSYR